MTTVDLQELAIVVAAKNHNPTLLNPDFLKCSGIIPQEWELARQPVYTKQVTQLVFQNGIGLVAQADRVMFLEGMGAKALQEMATPSIACQYIQALPHAEYQAVGINLRGVVPFAGASSAAQRYLNTQLLAAGSWQEFGKEPVRATVNLAYVLERGRLNLSISEATLQQADETTVPALMFAGNFIYSVAEEVHLAERTEKLVQCVEQWQADLEIYKDLVNNRFLTNVDAAQVLPLTPLLVGVEA